MIGNEFYEKHSKTVKKVATQASYRWNGLLDADDIEQDLWMFIMESPAVSEYMNTRSDGEIQGALKKKADSICSDERIAYDHFTGNYHYNTGEVASMFSRVLEKERLLSDEKVDMQLGLEELEQFHPNYHEYIHHYFVKGYPAKQGSEQMKKSRALEKLTDIMNRKRSQRERERTEGPGTRPAMTTNKEEQ